MTNNPYLNNTAADVSLLVPLINSLGEDITGLELGVCRGDSFLTLLHNCPNIKKLYGVDSWKPYIDYLKPEPDYDPAYSVSEQQSEMNKFITLSNLKYWWNDTKFEIIPKDSMEAIKEIPDKSLDFLFFDAMMSEEQTYQEALAYYPKLKKGGYFMGDDAHCTKQVITPIMKVMDKFKNKNRLTVYNRVFFFKV